MSPAATASLPALQPPAYQRHDTPLASSRSPMVGCVSGCFMTVLTRCGGYGGGGVLAAEPAGARRASVRGGPWGPGPARAPGAAAGGAGAAAVPVWGCGAARARVGEG